MVTVPINSLSDLLLTMKRVVLVILCYSSWKVQVTRLVFSL